MGDLYDVTMAGAPLVTVEWVDITGCNEPGLSRRWTVGHLLAIDWISEGVPSVVTATTWDEDGWSDYSTYPCACVLNLADLREALQYA